MKNPLRKSSPVAWFLLGVLVAGGTGTAYAANGGTFRLGKSNSATATTKLTNTKGTALKIISKAGTPPISVGSNSTKVPYLNADKLDGKDSSQFQTKITPLTFTALTPAAGWAGGCFTTAPGIAKSADGVIRFRGSICSATPGVDPASKLIFTLPAQFIPTATKYLTTNLCNVDGFGPRIGRIIIDNGGNVVVEDDRQDTGVPKASACFVSLDGLTYTLD